MAIKISGTTVVGDSRSLENVSIGASTITTLTSGISTTSTAKTLVNREFCEVTDSGQTITLPASPTVGHEVNVAIGNFTDTTVARNGSNIMSLAENITLDVAYKNVRFVYVNATVGWRID